MIPADVASSLRMLLPDQQALTSSTPQTQPVAPPQRIADALSNFVPGQRLMAEIQSMLPNGTYRAVVGQRDRSELRQARRGDRSSSIQDEKEMGRCV